MHVENLKRGDVIINSRQMDELKKSGKASGKGRVVGGENALSGFAHGTLNGMSAYAAIEGAGGGLGLLAPPEYVERKPGKGFDNENQTSEAVSEANRTVKTLIDLVQRSLDRYADITEDLDNQLEENLSSEKKQEILTKKYNTILGQIMDTGKAAEAYMKQALNYRYIDKQGVEQTYDLTEHLNKLAAHGLTLEDLQNGSFDLENTRFDLNDADEKLLYDAIINYQDMMDKAKTLSDNLPQLQSELASTTSAMDELPFDDLEKNLAKLENRMKSLNAFMGAASTGRAGINALSKALHEIFGDEADDMLNTAGSDYEVLNRMIE